MKFKNLFIINLIFLWIIPNVFAQKIVYKQIEIWPGVGPGSEGLSIEETITERTPKLECTIDRAIENVTIPTLTPFLPENPNGTAVIICPGGAFQRVVYDKEGTDIALWLNELGITAFVLKYRLPANDHEYNSLVPMQDLQRAIRFVKKQAEEYNIDTTKLGTMGASAGGYMATSLAFQPNQEYYMPNDSIDEISANINFMLLLYPSVYVNYDAMFTDGAPYIPAGFPPSFFAYAADDGSVDLNEIENLADSMAIFGVEASVNKYLDGGHGIGKCKTSGTHFANWPMDCTNWLLKMGYIDSTAIKTVEEPKEPQNEPKVIAGIDNQHEDTILKIYPSPVISESVFEYALPQPGKITLELFDVSGALKAILVNEEKEAGNYCTTLPSDLTEIHGLHFVKYTLGNTKKTVKVVFE